jgi:hydroxymethylbilane synthase
LTPPLLRIGTRGSALALAQTAELVARLGAAHAELAAPGAIETVVIRTSGDKMPDRPYADIPGFGPGTGKAVFTKEIEDALLGGGIDLAAHSGKDMPTLLPPGLAIAAALPREDPRDAFLSRRAASLAELPPGAVVGTSSPRRAAQILNARPDLQIAPLRGNVDTRLRKLDAGAVDAAILAMAGLKRLGLADRVTSAMPLEEILPAPAQGAIVLEIRAEDRRLRQYLAPIDDAATDLCVAAERAFLGLIDGSCRTPVAALAQIDAGEIFFRAAIFKPDGSARLAVARRGAMGEALILAVDAARELLARGGPDFFVVSGA